MTTGPRPQFREAFHHRTHNHVPRTGTWVVWVLLFLIIVLGASVRFYRITDLEPRIWDEGMYVLEGRYLSSFCASVWESARLFVRERLTGQDVWKKEAQLDLIKERIHGVAPVYGRILHDAFLAAGNLLAGETPYVGHLVNALLGSLTILWVFLLARRMFDERVGLYAALIFAVMGYHIHYCRSALAEANSLFFEVAAFYYYYRSLFRSASLSARDMVWCGLFLGLAFTVHNRSIALLGLIALLELFLSRRAPASLERARPGARMLLLVGFFLVPSFLWEGLYHLVLIVFRHLQTVMTAPTYLEQVLLAFWHSLLWGYISENFRLAGFLTFPYLYFHLNGIVASLVLIAGIAMALRRRSLADRVLGVWFGLPLLVYSLTNAGLTRFFSLILPPAAILSAAAFSSGRAAAAGRGSHSISKARPWARTRGVATSLALFALVWTALYTAGTKILPAASGYGTVVSLLEKQGDARMIATGVPLFQIYAGVEAVRKPPASMEELRRLYEDGFRYYVIDYNRIVYTYYQMERVEIMDRVAKDLEPTFNVSNTFILGPAFAFEGNLYFWKTLEILEKARDEEMDRIRVYDLREYFGSPPPPDQGEGESRDPLAPHRQDRYVSCGGTS